MRFRFATGRDFVLLAVCLGLYQAAANVCLGAVPARPTNLDATAISTSRIDLSWGDASGNETGFRIYRANSSSGSYSLIGTVDRNVTTFSNTGLPSDKSFYYKVRAYNSSGNSSYSNTDSARTFRNNPPPAAPKNLKAVPVSSSWINLVWEDKSDDERGFLIERAPKSSGAWTTIGTVGVDLTYFSDSGLKAASNYFYRVAATNAVGKSGYSNTTNAKTDRAGQSLVKGIYLLDSRSGTNRLGQLPLVKRRDFIDGFAWRMDWKDFDPGTNGPAYDFSAITVAVTNLQAMGKVLSFRLKLEVVPDHVLASANETYRTTFLDRNVTNRVTTVVPWDAPSFVHYTNFLHAMANHLVLDSSTGDLVPLREHPALATMRVSVLGRDHVARDGFDDLTRIRSYTRNRYIQAVLKCIRAAQAEFPSTPLHIGYFSLDDGNNAPPLDSDLLDALGSTFDGLDNPCVGFFQEVLTGDKPDPSGIYGENLLIGRRNGSRTYFQSVGSWTNHSPGEWTQDDDSPGNGFLHGFNHYGCAYYEMYPPDLFNPDFQSVFEPWHDLFESITD